MSATNMFQLEEQLQDNNIATVIDWKNKHESRPVFEEKNKDTELRILWLQWPRLKLVNRVLYREYEEDESTWLQFVVPIQMRDRVLFEMHDSWCNVHLGTDKTAHKLDKRYYWPRIRQDVRKYIQSCGKCAMKKIPKAYARAPLKPIKATYPFEVVTTDIQGPFPVSKAGNKYVLAFHDHYTKWMEVY